MTTHPILGTPLCATDYDGLGREVMEASRRTAPTVVDFSNTHVVTKRRHEPAFADLTRCVDIFAPDGMPLIWCMNHLGAHLPDRIYGPTFTAKFLASAPGHMSHYLVGGSAECGRQFRERMLALNPDLRFVGGYHGLCSADGILDEQDAVLAEIRSLRPDFIWVGLGTPKQYGWIARMKSAVDSGVFLAVGFAFDVNAGTKKDAPAWMQRHGLTWLFRMVSEPRRLATRYLKWNSLFLYYLMKDGLKKT